MRLAIFRESAPSVSGCLAVFVNLRNSKVPVQATTDKLAAAADQAAAAHQKMFDTFGQLQCCADIVARGCG